MLPQQPGAKPHNDVTSPDKARGLSARRPMPGATNEAAGSAVTPQGRRSPEGSGRTGSPGPPSPEPRLPIRRRKDDVEKNGLFIVGRCGCACDCAKSDGAAFQCVGCRRIILLHCCEGEPADGDHPLRHRCSPLVTSPKTAPWRKQPTTPTEAASPRPDDTPTRATRRLDGLRHLAATEPAVAHETVLVARSRRVWQLDA